MRLGRAHGSRAALFGPQLAKRSCLLMCHCLDGVVTRLQDAEITTPVNVFRSMSTSVFTPRRFYEGSFPLKAHKHVNT